MFNKELKQRMQTAEKIIAQHEGEILALKELIQYLDKKITILHKKLIEKGSI